MIVFFFNYFYINYTHIFFICTIIFFLFIFPPFFCFIILRRDTRDIADVGSTTYRYTFDEIYVRKPFFDTYLPFHKPPNIHNNNWLVLVLVLDTNKLDTAHLLSVAAVVAVAYPNCPRRRPPTKC